MVSGWVSASFRPAMLRPRSRSTIASGNNGLASTVAIRSSEASNSAALESVRSEKLARSISELPLN